MHHGITFEQLQRAFLIGGLICLVGDMMMVWTYGSSMSTVHALVLCGATAFAAGVWPAFLYMREMGAPRIMLGLVAALGVLSMIGALFSDLGYTVGLRTLSITQAHVQTTAYGTRQKQLSQNSGILETALKDAEAIKIASPWVLTMNINDGQAAVDAAHLKIDLETKRGGCGPICLKDKEELAGLEDKIATTKRYAELQQTIDKNRDIADKTADTAATTKVGGSWAEAQSDYVPKFVNALFGGSEEEVMNPSELAKQVSNIWIALLISVLMTFIPDGAIFIGTWGMSGKPRSRPVPKMDTSNIAVPGLGQAAAAPRFTASPTTPRVLRTMPAFVSGNKVA